MQNSTHKLIGITTLVKFLERGLSPLIHILGYIGAVAVGVMLFITVADIIGRRAFGTPVTGSTEISEFMLVITVFFSIAYCEYTRKHIAVGLVVDRLNKKTQNIIDSITYTIFLVTFSWLSRQLLLYSFELWHQNVVSGTLSVPIFFITGIAFVGCAILSFVILIHLLFFILGAFKHE